MNKAKIAEQYGELAAALGMTYDSQSNTIYGKKDDFDILIYAEDSQYPFVFTIHTSAKSVNGSVLGKDDLKEIIKTVNITQKGNQITGVIGYRRTQEKRKEALTGAVNGMISFLRSKGYVPCCSICNVWKQYPIWQRADIIIYARSAAQRCGATLRCLSSRMLRKQKIWQAV